MLKIDSVQTIEGLTVYGDDSSPNTFYVMPNSPTFRLGENNFPIFKFYKYRLPVDKEDGKKGGGFAIFDVELTVPPEKLDAVKKQLEEQNKGQQVKIGTLSFTNGKASLNLEGFVENKSLVEKVWNPGSPSLFGNFITPFTVEFSPEGATVFEQALQGKGGTVQVTYDMWTTIKLPPMKAHGHWDAKKFYSFFQDIKTEETWYGANEARREQVIEQCHNSEARKLEISWGEIKDGEIQNQIRDLLERTFDDAIARNLLKEATPVSDENRKLPDGIENVTRSMINDKTSDVDVYYEEGMPFEWHPKLQGTLPNITNHPDIKLEDYFVVIDADDPFFRLLTVPITVNADFEKLPLHSIEVHLEYNEGNTHKIEEPIFKTSNDSFKFRSYIENGNWKYKYWYQVNYKGQSRTFQSQEITTNEKNLVINLGDSGILHIPIYSGNIDFSKIPQVQVAIQYEDKEAGVGLIEEQFILDKDHRERDLVKVIFQPKRNQYRYRVTYYMADGTEYKKDWTYSDSSQLFINSPAKKKIQLKCLGDLEKDISNIYVYPRYEDATNNYVMTESFVLNKSNPSISWEIPIINETGGKLTYSGSILYMDGTTEDIDSTEAKNWNIDLGKVPDILKVEVSPDLIDFNTVKLAKVVLSYKDQANGINETKDMILKPDSVVTGWTVKLKDKSKKSYNWQATFFMKDNSRRITDFIQAEDETLMPDLSNTYIVH